MTPTRVVAAGLVVLLAAALALLALDRAPRRSGTDMTPNGAFVVVLNRGMQACQGAEQLPAGTAALQMTIGTYGPPGPPLSVLVSGARGETLTSGGLLAGWRQGIVRIPVARVHATAQPARVCLRNGGPGPVAVAGDINDPGYSLQLSGRTLAETRLRVDYMRPGRESWLSLLPTAVHRISLGKSDGVRHWAWIAVVLLMALAVALSARTIIAAGRRA